MTLNFPSSPTNGQVYESYVWDSTNSVWQELVNQTVNAIIANTPTGTYTDGGVSYKYLTFTANGTLNVTRGGLCDVLVVGGGGSGGVLAGGGGGAGGHLYIENAFLSSGNLDVIVGAGGIATRDVGTHGNPGSNGEASKLHTYYAPGGGAGAGCTGNVDDNNYRATKGLRGASGGGASSGNGGYGAASGGAGFTGLGNAGGNSTAALINCGGGGGAGAVGGNGVGSPLNGGVGGAGLANSITGTSVTRAGGGGGAGYDAGGAGGTGGGGNGGTGYATTNATAGTANTGSGGGGGMRDGIGGAGGSGVVIVRWVA